MSSKVYFENSPKNRCSLRRAIGAFSVFFFILVGCVGKDAAGAGTAPVVSFSPTVASFQSQTVGTISANRSIELSNTGKSALSISSLTLGGTNASDFAQTNNCGSSVAAGANCTIDVTFEPTARGTRTATISLTDNAAGSPQTVVLVGVSTAPNAALSPASLTFTSRAIGTASAAQVINLFNTGNSALSISSLAISGVSINDFIQNNSCGGSVAAGAHCTINVTFSPTAGGTRTAAVTLTDNATGSPQNVSLTGTGTGPAASLFPTSLTFGSQAVGATSAAQSVTLTNRGTAALNITGLGVAGTSASNFFQTNNCGSSVVAGGSCTINVTFTSSVSGTLAALLTIADNAPGGPQNVSLTGTGISTAPGQTVLVEPSDDLQTIVNEYPASTTFSLAPGTYRLQSVVPKSNDSFEGQTGAILSGAALLTTFTPDGSYWTAQVEVTEASAYRGECNSTSPACIYPEDLFFNSVPKTRVTSLASVGPGSWYLDYSSGTVYMGDDPSGSTVEISLLPYAFSGSAQSVIINNLIIEKYACQAGSGAVDGRSGSLSWTVENSEMRYNHGMGVGTGDGMYIYQNNIHHNGELGMGGGGSNVRVSSNQISYNNYAGYSYYWESGGAKFCAVTNLTVENNNSYNNVGPGFWNDINSQTVTYSGNQTSGNNVAGILFEISDGATIINNTITNDGYYPNESSIWIGGGIVISNSSDVTISGNTITNCMNGIGGILQDRGDNPSGTPYTLENVVAQGNTITQNTGMAMGIVVGPGYDNSVYTTMGNNFEGNTFVLTNPATGLYFYWMGEYMTLATWNSEVN